MVRTKRRTIPTIGETMIINTVTEAKAQLSQLIERVLQGEEVIISRAGKPVAQLMPYRASKRPRQPGRLKGKIKIAEDFDELPRDIAEAMGMVDE
jgi:prevent-host-death family protein